MPDWKLVGQPTQTAVSCSAYLLHIPLPSKMVISASEGSTVEALLGLAWESERLAKKVSGPSNNSSLEMRIRTSA